MPAAGLSEAVAKVSVSEQHVDVVPQFPASAEDNAAAGFFN
jgi:hypothetical protein